MKLYQSKIWICIVFFSIIWSLMPAYDAFCMKNNEFKREEYKLQDQQKSTGLPESEEDDDDSFEEKMVEPIISPATRYCQNLGYDWEKKMTEGGEIGLCVMPDGEKLDEWSFATGKIGEDWSYCERKGLELKVVNTAEKCQNVLSRECAVCVAKDGSEEEMTKLLQDDIANGVVVKEKTATKTFALLLLIIVIVLMMILAYFLLVRDKKGDEELK